MCYHSTYIFLLCGHVEISNSPVPQSHCLDQHARTIPAEATLPTSTTHFGTSLSSHPTHREKQTDSLPSPPWTPQPQPPARSRCGQKLVHPLHTLTINSLCLVCQEERDARIAAFDTYMRESVQARILTRSAERNERGAGGIWGQRRLLRASTTLAMIMDDQDAGSHRTRQGDNQWDVQSQPDSLKSYPSTPSTDAIGRIVDGFRGFVGYGSEGNPPQTQNRCRATSVASDPKSPQAKTPVRLSFAAFEEDAGLRSSRW
jgi:hypothetical protein